MATVEPVETDSARGQETVTSKDPEPATLKLIYEVIGDQLSKQFEQIEALTRRAQQLLAFAAGLLAITVGLRPPTDDVVVSVLFGIAFIPFTAAMVEGFRAWRIQEWRRDPEPVQLWEKYREQQEGWLRQQVVLNWVQSHTENRDLIKDKLRHLRRTQVLLGIEAGYLVVMLIVLPYVM